MKIKIISLFIIKKNILITNLINFNNINNNNKLKLLRLLNLIFHFYLKQKILISLFQCIFKIILLSRQAVKISKLKILQIHLDLKIKLRANIHIEMSNELYYL